MMSDGKKADKLILRALSLFLCFVMVQAPFASAEELFCEVMSVEGRAYLTNDEVSRKLVAEGDILKAADLLEIDAASYIDLAYDRDWANVIRIEENSKIRIRSVKPGAIAMEKGGIFIKLKSWPKESTFEVKTPTAIAAARGTEFYTAYDNGTTVDNFSDSEVYVFGLNEQGGMDEGSLLKLRNRQTTRIRRVTDRPAVAAKMSEAQMKRGLKIRGALDQRIGAFRRVGRRGRIQDLRRFRQRDQTQRERNRRGRFKRLRRHFFFQKNSASPEN